LEVVQAWLAPLGKTKKPHYDLARSRNAAG
jgi:hypothetical protein